MCIRDRSYVAVNEDTAALKNFYAPPSISKHVLSALPAFNVDEGNVTITNVSGLVLDSFNYHEDRHHLLIDKEDSCLLYTSPSPRDRTRSRMPSSA